MRRRIIHSTFTYQSSKLWTTRVINLHSDMLLVFLFFSLCRCVYLTMGRIHTARAVMHLIMSYSYMHHGGCCDTEAQYEAESVTSQNSWFTFLFAPVCIWTWRKNERLVTGSYIFAYSKRGRTVFSGSTGVLFGYFKSSAVFEVIRWKIKSMLKECYTAHLHFFFFSWDVRDSLGLPLAKEACSILFP